MQEKVQALELRSTHSAQRTCNKIDFDSNDELR